MFLQSENIEPLDIEKTDMIKDTYRACHSKKNDRPRRPSP